MHKELLIGSVHFGEIGHVCQEDVDLDDLGDVGAGSGQDCVDIVAAGLSELADGASD